MPDLGKLQLCRRRALLGGALIHTKLTVREEILHLQNIALTGTIPSEIFSMKRLGM